LRLKTQKEEERNKKSKIIKERLFKTREFIEAKTAMFYIAFGGEVNTQDMIKEALKLGKIVAVPVCRRNNRVIRPCAFDNNTKLKEGPYGICEPAIERFIDVKDLDLVVVPGVAFTRKGNRLGRGRGCYDYFLNKLPKKVASFGLAFDFQILPFIPATKTDVSVKRVISNEAIT